MIAFNQKGNGLVWLVLSLALIGVVAASYLVIQSNSKNSDDVFKQETSTGSPEPKSETKSEDIVKKTTITTSESDFGSILVDGEGQAIYIWELEESTTAECYGDCAEAWPPVLTDNTPVASGSVKGELLGTTMRTDGTTQVTYNGHPLYYYAHEEAGEVKCHNIRTHGGLWWVIQPSGIRAE